MITMVIIINFGKRLKELRQQNNLSQRKLATALGVAQSSITSYEAEQKSPTAEVIIKAAQYFKVSSDYLLGLSDEPLGGVPESVKKELAEAESNKNELDKLNKMFDDFAEKISKHYHQK